MGGPSKNSGYCKGLVCTRRIHIRHTIKQIRHLRLQSLSSKTTNIYVPVPYFWSTPTLWTSDRCIISLWSIRCAGIIILTYIIGPKKSPYICTASSQPTNWVIQWPLVLYNRCRGWTPKKKHQNSWPSVHQLHPKNPKSCGTLRRHSQKKTWRFNGWVPSFPGFFFCSDRFTWKNGWLVGSSR